MGNGEAVADQAGDDAQFANEGIEFAASFQRGRFSLKALLRLKTLKRKRGLLKVRNSGVDFSAPGFEGRQ